MQSKLLDGGDDDPMVRMTVDDLEVEAAAELEAKRAAAHEAIDRWFATLAVQQIAGFEQLRLVMDGRDFH